ncbi:MAG: tRNA uridine-5-carboxymethylaminomethyl(34) synthesis GTPase MnmE [Epsilonproteobacteria bacterium]|nr:tRNA uridine-5-carboxymethylaminomethyl(34) synthesis GTPase MnmE [Campylobacterota bacterium]
MSSTIVAIATATATSSISIVRVSGIDALKIAKSITRRDEFKERFAYLSSLYGRDGELIDQAVVIYFKAPKSFTGEDIVEFQCHGGHIVANEILESAIYYGARLAQAGEFSKRAFLNGKIDLTEAEAISKIIEAKSINGAKILARQLKGELKKFIDETRDELLKAISYAEVMIDYAEEDIPDDIINTLRDIVGSLELKMRRLVESSKRREGLISGFRVAIIGKPNVGKSSLLNSLLNYDRAIVSNVAGTTRDTIEEEIKISTHRVRLIDTAGIRDATDEVEKIGVGRSIASLEDADIIVAMFDNSREFTDEDSEILELIDRNGDKSIIVALNKVDLHREFDISRIEKFNYLEITADRDYEPIVDEISKILDSIGDMEEPMLISNRQIEAVSKARDALLIAREPLLNGELELFSYHLQDSVKYISSISKPFDSEEILDKMFSQFCLGK